MEINCRYSIIIGRFGMSICYDTHQYNFIENELLSSSDFITGISNAFRSAKLDPKKEYLAECKFNTDSPVLLTNIQFSPIYSSKTIH